MMDANMNQPINLIPQNTFLPSTLPTTINSKQINQSSRRFHLHLPAIILFAFSWLLHTIATFIPYWSIYSRIPNSRAGLWSAQYFNYESIQNFYFPELFSFPTITQSIRLTTANTKGYLITVQFLMTFNFVLMNILLILLTLDYIFSRRTPEPGSVLIRQYNTADTALIYGLLLYILYVFTVFEFASWITYVASRHDNNWTMHASFALTVIVSVFLIFVFVMYAIEFLQIFKKNRSKWDYWYGPYFEWGFFIHLSALLLLLIVICCPEWAYKKTNIVYVFGEIGLFKQCFFSLIYKKTASTGLCTLSDSRSNQSWVNATQAFILMAFIFGTIFFILIIIFRKEFRHNSKGYNSDRLTQPRFTFIIAGLILFFCWIFSLIGISIFGARVFRFSITVNWAYILAVIAMVLFLIAGILFILDGIHSRKQTTAATASSMEKFFFPEPLNTRVLAMQPLIKPEPIVPMGLQRPWPMIPPSWESMPPFNIGQQPPMYPDLYFNNLSFLPSSINYGIEPNLDAPFTQATLSNYFRQMMDNPQLLSSRNNQGLIDYSASGLFNRLSPNQINDQYDKELNEMVRRQLLQQQRLNYNHERLLERYSRIRTPRVSEYRSFGISSLPGRNYDQYLQQIRGNDDDYNRLEDSAITQSRARIGTADETYRWMGDEYYEPLSRNINSTLQNNQNDLKPYVYAEKSHSMKIFNSKIFQRIFISIRSILMQKTSPSHVLNHQQERNIFTLNNKLDDNQFVDRVSSEYLSEHIGKTNVISIDPYLFNIYKQRLNGDIQTYGQSFYTRSNSNDSIIMSFLFKTESILSKSISVSLNACDSFDIPSLEILSTSANDFSMERLANNEPNGNSSREQEHSIPNNLDKAQN